jgi:hypothetical protein
LTRQHLPATPAAAKSERLTDARYFDDKVCLSVIFDVDQWISTQDRDTLVFDHIAPKACLFDERKGFSTYEA